VGYFGVEDAQICFLRGRQRLLAEDRLAGLDAGEDVLLVGGPQDATTTASTASSWIRS
jgi:hypothetical protein